MRIGEIAGLAGVSVKTIRYYEEIGVLDEPHRLPSGYRDYDGETVGRIHFIRASQASGLTLGEIRGIVTFRDRGDSPCVHVLELLRRRSGEIEHQIAELQRSRDTIEHLVARARTLHPEDCSPSSVCHLIPKSTSHVRGADPSATSA